jgi:hypothetical protein
MHSASIMNMAHQFWESKHTNPAYRNAEQVVSTLQDAANKVVLITMRKISFIFDLLCN